MTFRIITLWIIFILISLSLSSQERVSQTFHKNGALQSQGIKILGEKNDLWKYWNKDSVLIKEKEFDNGQIISETKFDIKGAITEKIQGYQDLKFALKSEYKKGSISQRKWMYKRKSEFIPHGSGSSPASFLTWFDDHSLRRWTYHLSYKGSNNYNSTNIILPAFNFNKGGSLSSIVMGKIRVSYNTQGQITSYKGPVDKTLELYDCSFQTYDGKVHVKKDRRTVESDLAIDDFIGTVTLQTKDGLPDGIWKNKYPNGKIWYNMSFKKGFLDGPLVVYYANGQKDISLQFTKDIANGTFKKWYSNGQLHWEGTFEQGEMVGTWKSYNEKGEILSISTIYEQSFDGEKLSKDYKGNLKSHSFYEKGKRHGISKTYGYHGKIQKEELYDQDMLLKRKEYHTTDTISKLSNNGLLSLAFHKNKQLASVHYKDGINSMFVSYTEEGNIKRFNHNDGLKNVLSADFVADSISSYKYTVNDEDLDYKPYEFLTKWPKNHKFYKGEFLYDEPNGPWTFYHPNGEVWGKGEFENGLVIGYWEYFSLEGKKVAERNFSKGLLNGSSKTWNLSEMLKLEENYKNGLLDGGFKKWFRQNDNLNEEKYFKEGKLDGLVTIYNEDGRKKSESNYKNGNRHGLQTTFYKESDAILWQTDYVDDKKEGVSRKLGEDGSLLFEHHYLKNKKHGTSKEFDGVGNVVTESIFDYGDLIESSEMEELCSCNAGVNTFKNGRYFPSIKDLVDWQSILFQLDGKIQVSKSTYDNTYFGGLGSGNNSENAASLNLISRKEMAFEEISNPGIRYIINPCLKSGELSSIPLSTQYDYPILRIMGEEYKPEEFKGKPREYFEIGMVYRNHSFRDLIIKWINKLSSDAGYNSLPGDVLLKKALEKEKFKIEYDWENFTLDGITAKLAPQKSEVIDLIYNIYFGEATLDKENFPEDYAKFNHNYRYFFSYDRERIEVEDVDEFFVKYFAMQLGNHKLSIDFLSELLQPTDPKGGILTGQKARLTMSVSQFKYNSKSGLSIKGVSDICFTPAFLHGTKLSLQIPSITFQYDQYHTYTYGTSNDLGQLAVDNDFSPTYHIKLKECKGEWINEYDTPFKVNYQECYMEGEYIFGRINIEKSSEWSDQDQIDFLALFDDFEIKENNENLLSGMFLFKAKFN